MRSDAPALMPVFRSRTQAVILAVLLLRPDLEFSLTELAGRAMTSVSTVHDEVERLVAAEILSERFVGRSRLVRANTDNPAVRPLTDLVALTLGPFAAVRDAFAEVSGIEHLLLYGSWAARYHNEPGPPPRDVDVLVVGRVKRGVVYDAADVVEERTGLKVNPVVMSPERWARDDDPLVRTIKSSKVVAIAVGGA